MRSSIFTITLCFFSFFLKAQSLSSPLWQYKSTSGKNEVLTDIKWKRNANRLVATAILKNGSDYTTVFYVFDAETGKVLHRNEKLGGVNNNAMLSVACASDDTYYLVGYRETDTGKDEWILHLDENYKVIWQNSEKTYAKSGDDQFDFVVWDDFNDRGIIAGSGKSMRNGFVSMHTIARQTTEELLRKDDIGDKMAADITALTIARDGSIWACGNTCKSEHTRENDIWYASVNPSTLIARSGKITGRTPENVRAATTSYQADLWMAGIGQTTMTEKDAWFAKITPDMEHEIIPYLGKNNRMDDLATNITSFGDGGVYAILKYPGATQIGMPDSDEHWIIENGENFDVKGFLKIQEDYFLIAGTDEVSGVKTIRIIASKIMPMLARKGNVILTCKKEDIRFRDKDGNGILSPNETGKILVTVRNEGDAPFNGGYYNLAPEFNGNGLTLVTERRGYLPFIAAKSSSEPIPITIKAGSSLTEGSSTLRLILDEKSGVLNVKIDIKTGSKPPSAASYTYNKPAVRDNASRQVPVTEDYVELEIIIRTDKRGMSAEDMIVNHEGVEVTHNKEQGKMEGGNMEGEMYEYKFIYTVKGLKEGSNEIFVTSRLDQSVSKPIKVLYEKERPNLHILAIGPSYKDLKFTRKDALDFVATMYQQRKNGFFGEVFIDTLLGVNATDDAIYKRLESMLNQSQNLHHPQRIKSSDYVMVFYSGHGTRIDNEFYLAPHGFTIGERYTSSVNYKDMVNKFISRFNCKSMLFIDACQSGSAEKSLEYDDAGLNDLIVRVNSAHPGITSFSSCSGSENSYEYIKGENGVFTQALLDAFSFQTFLLGRDKISIKVRTETYPGTQLPYISIEHLAAFLEKRVPNLQWEQADIKKVTQNPTVTVTELDKWLPVFFVPRTP